VSPPDGAAPVSVPLEDGVSETLGVDASVGLELAGSEGVADAVELPPIAASRLAASVAAVSFEAPAGADVEVDVDDEDGDENPAAGRSGRRTSTYDAPAALGEASTRASDSHLACERVASPK
jgi:hypothetical protein